MIRLAALITMTLLLGVLAGVSVANEWEASREFYSETRLQVRTRLGLPKRWQSLPSADRAASRTKVACPSPDAVIVIVSGGQSNAANNIPTKHVTRGPLYEWFDGQCFKLRDPLLGATGKNGSIWSLYAEQLSGQTGQAVMVIAGAVGGTQFADWNDPRSGYYAALRGRIDTARKAGYRIDAIIWHQGETDAAVERDLTAFRKDAGDLIGRLLADVPSAPLYLFQASRCTGTYRENGVPGLVRELRTLAATSPRIIAGMNTDALGKEYRWDTCHFNALGRRTISSELLEASAQLGFKGG